MFEILAGDYGKCSPEFSHFGFSIPVTPETEENLKGFNNQQIVFGKTFDALESREDVRRIEILDEESYEKQGLVQFTNTVLGASAYGPAGALLGNVGKNKKDILFFVETTVGNSFIAKANERVFRSFKSKFGPSDEQIASEAFYRMQASEGNNSNDNNQETSVEIIKELEKIAALKEKGLLTEEEFSVLKSDLMNKKKRENIPVLKPKTIIKSESSFAKRDKGWQEENQTKFKDSPENSKAQAFVDKYFNSLPAWPFYLIIFGCLAAIIIDSSR